MCKKQGGCQVKKIIAITLLTVSLMSVLTVTLLAATYKAGPNVEPDVVFDKDFVANVYNGAITKRYNVGGWFSDARASTDISLANDYLGYAHVRIQELNGNIYTCSSKMEGVYGIDCNNVINSGIVSVPGQNYAVNVFYTGWREHPDGALDTYCVDGN